MFIKVANTFMSLAMLVGAVLTLMLVPKTHRLRADVQRLEQIYGSATADDLQKIYVRAIDTGKPFHFMWRIYVPPAPGYKYWHQAFGSGMGMDWKPGSNGSDFILTCAIRPSPSGVETYVNSSHKNLINGHRGFSAFTHGSDLFLADFDRFNATIAGLKDMQEFSANELVELVSLSPTQALVDEVATKYGNQLGTRLTGPISIRLGLPSAFSALEIGQ